MLLLPFSGDGHDSVTSSAKKHDSEHPPFDVKGTILITSALHCVADSLSCFA